MDHVQVTKQVKTKKTLKNIPRRDVKPVETLTRDVNSYFHKSDVK